MGYLKLTDLDNRLNVSVRICNLCTIHYDYLFVYNLKVYVVWLEVLGP